jgi:hypothetical protein
LERFSLREVARFFAMACHNIKCWLIVPVQNLPDVKEPFLLATPDEVFKLDEIWSVVQKKEQKP